MCVEPKQKYKYNCLQKCWKLSLLPKFWGPPKSGALGLSLFSLMVNPRLDMGELRIWAKRFGGLAFIYPALPTCLVVCTSRRQTSTWL